MAVRIVGFKKLPRSGLVQHCILAADHHTALDLPEVFSRKRIQADTSIPLR
ncbi:hypothetical protein [Paenibacillus crassostreae]|uniref:hypothetical protein n=1 Tax=Paenibacillus crassostreae TaxID=1763538 RepID=UPI0012FE3340|nr:hypothetical protein [Paenibacillus crassostreae]